MEYNTQDNRKGLIRIFPKLASEVHFSLESPFTFQYNCIAWAMQMQDRWVDVANIPWHWWPENVQKNQSEEALIEAFEALSFEMCDSWS